MGINPTPTLGSAGFRGEDEHAIYRLTCIHSSRGVVRLQGAALVAVRKLVHMLFLADGHKGRTLQSSANIDMLKSWWTTPNPT